MENESHKGRSTQETKMKPGPKNSITDIPGLKVGNSEDLQIKTGVSVLVADRPFTAAVHVMGGAPGTRETDLLAPDKLVQAVDAIVLSGGSAFGLDAASGVADSLLRAGRGFAVESVRVPIVPGAILFDLLNGGKKERDKNPYKQLGHRALEFAADDFNIGSVGAGTGALAGKLKGGLGTASAVTEGGYLVGALVAVNSFGSVVQPGHANFWAASFEMESEFGGLGLASEFNPSKEQALAGLSSHTNTNTTIAIVATDAKLSQAQATRLAVTAHDGMARSIVPSHTVYDGDLVFAAATGEKEIEDSGLDFLNLGHAAATCLARAVARGVYNAESQIDDLMPTWIDEFG